MAKYPSEEQDRFIVRMPTGMRDRLKAAAAKTGRSMNAEIVARLDTTLAMPQEIEDLVAAYGLFARTRLADVIRKITAGGRGHEVVALPSGLLERIEAKAAELGRTPNAEAVETLEKAYPVLTGPTYREFIEGMRKGLDDGTMTHSSPELEAQVRTFVEVMEAKIAADPAFGDSRPTTGIRPEV